MSGDLGCALSEKENQMTKIYLYEKYKKRGKERERERRVRVDPLTY